LFRRAERTRQTEEAEADARRHIERALELAPGDPTAVSVLVKNLIENRRFDEALQTLDRVAPRFPRDVQLQTLYALALGSRVDSGREEDAFVAYSRVWKLSGQVGVDVSETDYRRLAQGFDLRVANLGKSASQLANGVANGAVTPTSALLQLTRLKEDMSAAEAAINIIRPPASVNPEAVNGRIFAADLMNQALEAYQTYLDVGGQEIYRSRGLDLHRQSIARINAARTLG
jgi:tetratricopeptide (TPR) repeat protein